MKKFAQAQTDLVEKIRLLLAGKGPELQGAALAELTAMWLAGHPEEVRDDVLKMQTDFIRELARMLAAEIWARRN